MDKQMDGPMKEQPDLSERELSTLLDIRDRDQELKRRRLGRWVTLAVSAVVAAGLIAIFSFKESGDLAMSLFKDAPPPPSTAPADPSHPTEVPEAVSDQMQNAKNLMDFMQLGKGSSTPEKK